MTALVENRAVLSPERVLTPTQQNALRCLASYKHQRKVKNAWWIGNVKFSAGVMERLETYRLLQVRRHTFGTYLKLTTAGELAAERLRKPRA